MNEWIEGKNERRHEQNKTAMSESDCMATAWDNIVIICIRNATLGHPNTRAGVALSSPPRYRGYTGLDRAVSEKQTVQIDVSLADTAGRLAHSLPCGGFPGCVVTNALTRSERLNIEYVNAATLVAIHT